MTFVSSTRILAIITMVLALGCTKGSEPAVQKTPSPAPPPVQQAEDAKNKAKAERTNDPAPADSR